MTKPRREPVYRWQKFPIFRFFATVRLAMLLLSVLIVASILGTIYESNLDAKVARHYIYEAPWFGAWLLLLALNLAGAAFSRMPWEKHHTGFLVTHLGIIILLAGSWIGRTWGVEGTMTLFEGEPPNNALLVDQKVLQIINAGRSSKPITVEVLGRKPSPAKPWPLASTPDGWQIEMTDHSSALELDMTPKALSEGGTPALHLTISTAMMGQKLDSWLLADDPGNGVFNMGLASITLKRGVAPGASTSKSSEAPQPPTGPVEIEEAIFAFAKAPDQVGKSLKGGSTGAKIRLENVSKESGGTVVVEYHGATQRLPLPENMSKDIALPETALTVSIKNYWPDFRIKDGAPESVTQEPNNPAVLVMIRGNAVPVAVASAPDHSEPAAQDAAGQNSLTIFAGDDGALTYELSSRKGGKSSGALELNKPLPTGWADWTLLIDQSIPHAREHFTARPATSEAAPNARHTEGIRIRATRGSDTKNNAEEWVPLGWQISLPTEPPLGLSYGFRQIPLPIGLRLLEFEVERNEGTDTPAGFKSTVEITDINGGKAQGQCWMNNPISYPASWVNTWSGFTYKISQASWNPENLNQSTVQILRDPGWGSKWIGCLLVVSGVFTMFYLRPYPKDLLIEQPSVPARGKNTEKTRTPVSV